MPSFSTRLFEMMMRGTAELSNTSLMVRMALIGCSIFAFVHLISLWGTRYGDKGTLSKSLFLSLMLHCCFGLGWFTVVEGFPSPVVSGDPELVNTPIHFRETVDSAPEIGTNPLPIFNSGPATPGPSVARENRITRRLEVDVPEIEIESPPVNKVPEIDVSQEAPQFLPPTDEAPPELLPAKPAESKPAASEPITLDQPSQEARPEVAARTNTIRSNTQAPTSTIELPSQPDMKRGASSRVAPMIEEGEVMTFPSEIAMDSIPKLTGSPHEQTIRRQASPRPADVNDNVAGTGPEPTNTLQEKVSPRRTERMTRPSARKGEGKDDVSMRPSLANNAPKVRNPDLAAATVEDRLTGPGSLEPLDDSTLPSVERPIASTMSRSPARAPETYKARQQGQRMSSVLRNGGTEESEKAVEASLKWLASVQESEGNWSSDRHGGGSVDRDPQGNDRLGGGKKADAGVTGLVVLSFLGAGYTHEKGPYTAEIKRALDWLIGQQAANGYLGGKNASKYDQNYCHAIATFALAEAYAMQKDGNDFPQLRYAVKRGVEMISALQNDDGGWRYGKGVESDMSMFGWQLMALKSAVNAGIPVPEKTRRGMVTFLEARGLGEHKGLAGYKKDDPPTPAMTAEALFCRQMFNTRSNDNATQEAVRYLKRNLPRVTAYDEYYWYYGTLAMHQVDDESWQDWNNALRDMLISMQRRQGPLAGSWDPRGKWAGIGGRLYSTALSTMCLEVYYRYQSTSKPSKGE